MGHFDLDVRLHGLPAIDNEGKVNLYTIKFRSVEVQFGSAFLIFSAAKN